MAVSEVDSLVTDAGEHRTIIGRYASAPQTIGDE